MAMSRALRDILRHEEGMVSKRGHSKPQRHADGDQVTCTQGSTPKKPVMRTESLNSDQKKMLGGN